MKLFVENDVGCFELLFGKCVLEYGLSFFSTSGAISSAITAANAANSAHIHNGPHLFVPKVIPNVGLILAKPTDTTKHQAIPFQHTIPCPASCCAVSASAMAAKTKEEKKKKNVRIACAALIENTTTGRVLLTRRAKNLRSFPLEWVVCGGHIEENETIEEAASREVQEETGLVVSPDAFKPLCMWESTYSPSDTDPKLSDIITHHHIVYYLTCKVHLTKEEEISSLRVQPSEVDSVTWVNHQDLLHMSGLTKSISRYFDDVKSTSDHLKEISASLAQGENNNDIDIFKVDVAQDTNEIHHINNNTNINEEIKGSDWHMTSKISSSNKEKIKASEIVKSMTFGTHFAITTYIYEWLKDNKSTESKGKL